MYVARFGISIEKNIDCARWETILAFMRFILGSRQGPPKLIPHHFDPGVSSWALLGDLGIFLSPLAAAVLSSRRMAGLKYRGGVSKAGVGDG